MERQNSSRILSSSCESESRLDDFRSGKNDKLFQLLFHSCCRTLEKHIQEVLECYRRRLADAIIDDLLDVAVKTEDKVESDMEITRSSVIPLKDDEAPSVPVAIKSFSFV